MSESLRHIKEMTESIICYNSRKPLHVSSIKIDDELLRSPKATEEIETAVNSWLDDFVKETKLSQHIVQLGMTFVWVNKFEGTKHVRDREKTYFFHSIDNSYRSEFEKWLTTYREFPIQVNKLLCDQDIYKNYWKSQHYSFPRFIIYQDNNQYIGSSPNGNLTITEMNPAGFQNVFGQETEKFNFSLIDCLRKKFIEEESWSPVKIFQVSNFRDEKSQTFIKFNKKICDINNPTELSQFLGLCYLLDLTIGSVAYDFDIILHRDEYKKEILAHGTKSALSAIMSRNLSHNIGSHVLSGMDEEYIKTHYKEVVSFKTYLQKRMDLLARILGESVSWGEPVLFVNDLLGGFFSQTLLLNQIVKDQRGWTGVNIEFAICKEDATDIYIYKEKEGEWKWDCDARKIKDFLVAIPDGIVGMQAFYVFMEGYMRNSAKYGTNEKHDGKIKIALRIEEKPDHYIISVCDNISLCNGSVTGEIKEKIKKDLVGSDGQIISEAMGIAEMKAACAFLFPSYEAYPANNDTTDPYPLWVDCPSHDVCHDNREEKDKRNTCSAENPCECNHLSYIFHIAKPKMIGLYGSRALHYKYDVFGIHRLESIEMFASAAGAYQFAVIDGNALSEEEIQIINKNITYFPSRIIIFYDNDIKLKANKFQSKKIILCKSTDLKFDSASEFILSVFNAWILNKWLKGIEKLSLIISFSRPQDAYYSLWKKHIDNLGNDNSILAGKVNVHLYRTVSTRTGPEKMANCLKPSAGNGGEEIAIVYDNHSYFMNNANKPSHGTVRFVHEIGKENFKIFSAIEAVPEDPFVFRYFLLGLIESALCSVVIIDERVASEIILESEGESPKCDGLQEMNNALCYPIYTIKSQGLNEAVSKKISAVEENSSKCMINHLNKMSENGAGGISVLNLEKDVTATIDCIIIHNGIIESHAEFKQKQLLNKLQQITDNIVITSGRGVGAVKGLDIKEFPFIEFSMLKDNCYPMLSKYHLVRAVMSAKGVKKDD